MSIGNIHHIGYLVKNIEKSLQPFLELGYEMFSDVKRDQIRRVRICFLKKGENLVELVEPNVESEVYPLLKQYRNRAYHICYEVDDIDKAVRMLKKKGFLHFSEKGNAPVISGTAKVAFLIHSQMGLIELIESYN